MHNRPCRKSLGQFFILLLLLAGVCAGVARAQVIAWQTPFGIQREGDLSTAGTYVDAITAYAGPHLQGEDRPAVMIKMGDTTFHTITGADATYGDGTISISASPKVQFFNSNLKPIPSGRYNAFPVSPQVSAAYSALVSNGAYFKAGPVGSIHFSQLTGGNIYQVQIWCFVQDGATSLTDFSDDAGHTLTLDPAAHVPKTGTLTAGNSYGQFALGWFRPPAPRRRSIGRRATDRRTPCSARLRCAMSPPSRTPRPRSPPPRPPPCPRTERLPSSRR